MPFAERVAEDGVENKENTYVKYRDIKGLATTLGRPRVAQALNIAATLHGDKVALRPLRLDDLDRLFAWDSDTEIVELSGKKFDTVNQLEWYRRYNGHQALALAIVDGSGALVGDIELENINWRRREAEIRICIGEKHLWNQGYGTDAMRMLIAYARDMVGLASLYLRVYSSNVRAIRCYQKAGFRPSGVLRRDGEILLMTRRL